MKSHKVFFILLTFGFLSLSALSVNAQNAVCSDSQSTTPTIEIDSLQNYVKLSSLPVTQRPKAFSDLSAEHKAKLFKLHLAFQLVKRPSLTKEQKNVILEGLSIITTDSYNKEIPEKRAKYQQEANLLEQKAKAVFPGKEAFEIFASLGGNQEDIEILQKYLNLIAAPTTAKTKKSFEQMASIDKSAVWKIQMTYYLAQDEELNKLQKDFILRMIDFVNPQMFELLKGSSERNKMEETLKGLKGEADNLFSEKKIFLFFSNLGDSKKAISKDAADNSDLARDCTCRGGWTSCSSG